MLGNFLNKINKEKGFALFYASILILAIVLVAVISISTLTYNQQKIFQDIVKSSQAYYAAEAGIEDVLLRLENEMDWSSSYGFDVGTASVNNTVSDDIGGSKTIAAEGNSLEKIRKVTVNYEASAQDIAFNYGAQAGDGGIIMDDISKIYGNVFSNGSITDLAWSEITGTAKVAQNGNEIQGIVVREDAYVDICRNSIVYGTLTASTKINCIYTEFVPLTEEIATSSLPITEEQINKWKDEAVAGGTISGDYIVWGFEDKFLGPKKIEGDMIIQGWADLFITGTVWVTGDIILKDSAKIRLDSDSYGSMSGTVISDGQILLKDWGIAQGSGEAGSYLLLISTFSGDPAITVEGGFFADVQADIIYAPNGWITMEDWADVVELTGYGIRLENYAEIRYETGVADISFSSEPGYLKVTNWKEIE